MIKLVVDSTFYLTKKFCEDNDIQVVSLTSTFEGEEYVEGYPGTYKPFFDKVSASKSFPITSQPTPEAFKKVFQKILDDGNEVLSLSFSSTLSGTFQSSEIAKKEIGSDKITTCDTRLALAPLWFVVEEVLKMIKQGKTREEIAAKIPDYVSRAHIYSMPVNLNYFIKGGRLKGLAAIIGKVISIKPIIAFENGVMHACKKALTLTSGENYMINCVETEYARDNIEKFYFGYVYDDKYLNAFKEKVLKRCPDLKIEKPYCELGNVIGSHTGPYTYGCMYVTKR